MQIYNTQSRKKEDFTPSITGKVSLYVCGITTYDYAHIGHARSAIAFDVLVRFLRYKQYEVLFIRNFTDVDDKIIARANKEQCSCAEISERFIKAYHRDLDMLNVLRPTIEPKATEHITDMIECIEKLIALGNAYSTVSGDVYYKVRSCEKYGELSGHSIDSLYESARIEKSAEKEDALDFALWKSAKAGEPYWESPWGNGRPGWHIECSAMSKKYAELPIDIHGGGRDLIFPHHENEKAQTESMCGCTFVRYWMHNGFVQIQSEKMSKSLNNFTTVDDIYKEYLPEVLRYFLLTKHYRTPIDFSLEGMVEAEKNLRTIYTAKKTVLEYIATHSIIDETLENEYITEYKGLQKEFFACLEDDVNTACALGHIFSMVHIVSKVLHEVKDAVLCSTLATFFVKDIEIFSSILGVFSEKPKDFLQNLRMTVLQRKGLSYEEIEQAIAERLLARSERDFVKADAIRDMLLQKNVVIKDSPEGTKWDIE